MALTKRDLEQVKKLIDDSAKATENRVLGGILSYIDQHCATKNDILELEKKISHLPTKDEFYAMEDKLLHEVVAEREENVIQHHQLLDHERGLHRLEKKTQIVN